MKYIGKYKRLLVLNSLNIGVGTISFRTENFRSPYNEKRNKYLGTNVFYTPK